jgi:hypothetical protein
LMHSSVMIRAMVILLGWLQDWLRKDTPAGDEANSP